MWKTIICLANSRKMSGRCIAGKETAGSNKQQRWIRPVSRRDTGEISEAERRFENGGMPKVLDILSIKLIEPSVRYEHQSEDWLIDSRAHWKKAGEAGWRDLEILRDRPDQLWKNGCSSSVGENDRVPESEAAELRESLFFIQPKELKVIIQKKDGKKKARTLFNFNNVWYNLSVTDPAAERRFFRKGEGEYPLARPYLCVSLGEPLKGYCYKLAAAVMF